MTIQVPSAIGSAWSEATVYVYGCSKAAQTGPAFVSSVAMPVSYAPYSSAIVWVFLISIYLLIALAAKLVDKQGLHWLRYLDPVVLTAGSNGKGNLAKLQILFFSMIVAGLVGYIVSRTGILSDLSSTILLLLGIGVGSAAAKATDVSRNRPSVVVGGALLVVGLRDLASFSIPETLLGVLGLSQVVYIGGKLVAPPTCSELNTATTALREMERDFVATAGRTPDPQAPTGANPLDPPANLDAAIRRAAAHEVRRLGGSR